MPRPRNSNPRPYARMSRVNDLCLEIVAEELERIDDERLDLVTVTHVSVDRDLRRGLVEFAGLGEGEDEALEALGEHRIRLQAAIGRQARLKNTPELSFRPDDAIAYAARIEELLAKDPSRDRTHDE